MTEGEKARLVAWSRELHAVHKRLREALRVTRNALDSGDNSDHGDSGNTGNAGNAGNAGNTGETAEPLTRELLLFCHGFCTALTGHHEGEDRELFPAIAEAHPELRETLRQLEQDHSMIAHLLTGLQAALERNASRIELDRHLEGIEAIMENHFRYEERQLLAVLDTLALDADPRAVLGPL